MTSRARRTSIRLAGGAGAIGLLWVGLTAPLATTKQGVDFEVTAYRVPLYAKAADFLARHAQYRLLARQVTQGLTTDAARVEAVLRWTHEHIRPTPEGWPVVDDHVLNIIIRGYGLNDQMADVFTTLTTYAGVPAFWRVVERPEGNAVLSFAKVNGRWIVIDAEAARIVTDQHGRWLDVEALLNDPALLRRDAGLLTPHGVPYWKYLEQLRPFHVPRPLRAETQMPIPRLGFELRKIFKGGSFSEG